MEPAFQVFRGQKVSVKDIKPDTKAIMISSGAYLEEEKMPDHVLMIVFGYLRYREKICHIVHPVKVMSHCSDARGLLYHNNSRQYMPIPNETDHELLQRLFIQEFPDLAKGLLTKNDKRDAYLNAIKRSVDNHVQKRVDEVIDIIDKEDECVLGKRITLVMDIDTEAHVRVMRDRFAEFFPVDHMSIEEDTDVGYSLVLIVSAKI